MNKYYEAIIPGCPTCGHGEVVHTIASYENGYTVWHNVPGTQNNSPSAWGTWLKEKRLDPYDRTSDMFVTLEEVEEVLPYVKEAGA